MQWENLTGREFLDAVRKTGVCVISMGVLEKHGEHLPIGTDMLIGHRIAALACQREEAVAFPPFYIGQTHETLCHPGSISLKPSFLVDLIEGVIDQIGHNGFRKIVVASAHGGNRCLLPFIAQCSFLEEKPYSIYLHDANRTPEFQKAVNAIVETEPCHACEYETSLALACIPELVRLERIPSKPSRPTGRLDKLAGGYTGLSWYADYPEHYAGDARKASVEKGRKLLELHVGSLAKFIWAVKRDKALPAVKKEFFSRVRRLREGRA